MLEFKNLRFKEENNIIKVILMDHFYFNIPKKDNALKNFKIISENSIDFNDSEKKFNLLLSNGLRDLKSFWGRNAVYIHQNSGIPLIGSGYFGIVDRGTNLIEIKPITGCNLDCIYCSVDEGKSSKRYTDFVIEKDYLIQELKKLIDFKNCDVEVHIGTQGEPLLYSNLTELIEDISKIKNIINISMDTNGQLLTEKKVDELINAGLTRFHLSLNTLNPETAKKMSGGIFNLDRSIKIAKYIAKKGNIILTPVVLKGINDKDLDELIKFGIELQKESNSNKTQNNITKNQSKPTNIYPPLGIQNFLNYKHGRNPVKQISWEEFYENLKDLENKYNLTLILDPSKLGITKAKSFPKPFKKDDVVKAELKCAGRLNNEMIAVAKDRTIQIPQCSKKEGFVKVKITRIKHNIFIGQEL